MDNTRRDMIRDTIVKPMMSLIYGTNLGNRHDPIRSFVVAEFMISKTKSPHCIGELREHNTIVIPIGLGIDESRVGIAPTGYAYDINNRYIRARIAKTEPGVPDEIEYLIDRRSPRDTFDLLMKVFIEFYDACEGCEVCYDICHFITDDCELILALDPTPLATASYLDTDWDGLGMQCTEQQRSTHIVKTYMRPLSNTHRSYVAHVLPLDYVKEFMSDEDGVNLMKKAGIHV